MSAVIRNILLHVMMVHQTMSAGFRTSLVSVQNLESRDPILTKLALNQVMKVIEVCHQESEKTLYSRMTELGLVQATQAIQ